MLPTLAACLILALAAPKPTPKLDCGAEISCELFSTPTDAFKKVLEAKPRVISIGEVHQTTESTKVPSAISRFTKTMLPALKLRASDLLAETWFTEGNCGEEEKQAVAEIEETTKRPAETEDEVMTLLKQARALGILPHILKVSCDEYRSLLDKDQEISMRRRAGSIFVSQKS